MNPLHWKRAHQTAWAITILAGGAGGMIFGWLVSPFSHLGQVDTATMFMVWLHYPMTYLPWAAIGAVMGGLTYYSADLMTGSR